jgi:hypothetical protein
LEKGSELYICRLDIEAHDINYDILGPILAKTNSDCLELIVQINEIIEDTNAIPRYHTFSINCEIKTIINLPKGWDRNKVIASKINLYGTGDNLYPTNEIYIDDIIISTYENTIICPLNDYNMIKSGQYKNEILEVSQELINNATVSIKKVITYINKYDMYKADMKLDNLINVIDSLKIEKNTI